MPRSPSWIDPELLEGLPDLAPGPERGAPATGGGAPPLEDEQRGGFLDDRPETAQSAPSGRPSAGERTEAVDVRPHQGGEGTVLNRVQLLGRWLRLVLDARPHYVLDADGLTLLEHDMPQRGALGAHAERAASSLQRLIGGGPVRSVRVAGFDGRTLTAAWFDTAHGRMGLGVLDHELDEALLQELGFAFREVFERP